MILKDIAERAGVSSATVSNVINGKYHKVSKETIEKVQRIIEENNYNPNAAARSLASKKSKIIGVVIADISENEAFSISPYNTQMLAFLERYIRKQGYYMMIRCVGSCKAIVPVFSTWSVDGVIFLGARRSEVREIKEQLTVPTVYIDTYAEDLGVVSVGIDDYKGGYLAARYLLGNGHRKIAFVGPDVNASKVVGNRYRGFCDACREKNVEVPPTHIFEAYTIYEHGVKCGRKIAFSEERFTAVMAMSDILAFGVIEGLRLCGVQVPGDISVIGFDNLPEGRYSNPQLTTVSQNLEKKAFMVGECLFQMIRGKEEEERNEKVDVEIVERHSVKTITDKV